MGALASGLAHNFNNLLTVVLGNINLALRESAGGEVREYLRDAFESAQSAAKLTRQMLAYAGKGAVARVPTSASEVAQKTVQLVRASLPENIEFRTELAPNLPSLLTDPRQLQQVLTNLLLNAAESFGPAQGGTVTLRAEWRHERLCLSVSDTGCGMDAVTQSRIFDPFFSTKALGRGLGLPAAQGIVRSLGGEIHIESSVGRGTCVTVLLPAAPTPVVAPEPAPAAPLSPRQVAKQDQAATLDQVP
jgi:signal transduction histidine kinase